MAVNDDILDAAIRHEVEIRRFDNATLRKIIVLLNRSADRITAELIKRGIGDESFTKKRLELLLEAVKTINAKAYERITDALDANAKDLAGYEGEFQLGLLKRMVPVRLDMVTPSTGQLWAAVNARPFQGRLLKDYYKDLPVATFARIKQEISQGFAEGRTTDQIVRDIRGTARNRYKDGVIEATRRSTEMTVRTALNHTANVARNEVYKANEDIIKAVRWVSTLDGRTSAVCRGRDGKTYPVNSGPRPPAHPNCRSTTSPVLKSWKELGIDLKEAPPGTRASMNGQVPGDLTYNDWLKKQPKDFQDEALGPTKAKLYRNGGLSLDRFIDKSGNEYTIDELRRREEKAFERVGL